MPRTRKPRKETCTFTHSMKLEITQLEARCISLGGFLPRSVADKMIGDCEALYRQTEGREAAARIFDPTLRGKQP